MQQAEMGKLRTQVKPDWGFVRNFWRRDEALCARQVERHRNPRGETWKSGNRRGRGFFLLSGLDGLCGGLESCAGF